MTQKDKKKIAPLPNQCPYHKKCGGCSLQNMDYERQLKFKQSVVNRLLGNFGRVGKIAGMETPVHYRNKAQASFVSLHGRLCAGVYQSATGRTVPVENCMIQDETSNRIIAQITRLAASFKIRAYNPATQTGILRHILVRRGFATGEIMAVLVLYEDRLKNEQSFVNAILSRCPEITTLVINISKDRRALVLGAESRIVHGGGKITDVLCGKKFLISPHSFYQVNPVQTQVLYETALEFAGLTGSETVIDAYCGIGTIGIAASDSAKRVIGADSNAAAIADAVENAALNEIKTVEFYPCDAGNFMEQFVRAGEKADVLFMDPPRAGSSRKFLASSVALSPEKIVYISCNPQTLRRDLFYLTKHGYQVKKIKPVDMFPYTSHVETVVLLSKLNTKQNIEVELNLDERI